MITIKRILSVAGPALIVAALSVFLVGAWNSPGLGAAIEGPENSGAAFDRVERVGVVREPSIEPLRRVPGPPKFSPRFAAFELFMNGDRVPYDVLGAWVLPGQTVELETAAPGAEVCLAEGRVTRVAGGRWIWTAPLEPGAYALKVTAGEGPEPIRLNVFVMHPFSRVRNGKLNGFTIGNYPRRLLSGDPAYEPPAGFIEVTRETEDVLVSPHFTLAQFRCKQGGHPAYVALSAPLVVKLEELLALCNESGMEVRAFQVMSGFRTPSYNRRIGNRTTYSRHCWGDAADIYVDDDGDGMMDDLNRDGRVCSKDAALLAGMVERLERSGTDGVEPGGLSAYKSKRTHGPFVHVDARGRQARW
jgi:hypothetical protein